MGVKKYSLQNSGNLKLSKNFTVKEFRCKDDTDTIYISDELVGGLQKIRDKYNLPVNIISGYRNPVYNKKVNGATNSQHLLGTAADISIKGVVNKDIAIFAETLLGNKGGIGFYDYSNGFVHIDVRAKRARWKQDSKSGKQYNVAGFYWDGKALRKGDKGKDVETLQNGLNKKGYNCGKVDGIFGDKTLTQVKKYQKDNGLTVDGIAGQKTLSKLYS